MSIDKDTVKHISKLARISLDEKKINNLSMNFIIEERSLDKLSILLSSNEILANFDMCFTVSLSIDI